MGRVAPQGGGSCSWGTAVLVGVPVAAVVLAGAYLLSAADLPRSLTLASVYLLCLCMFIVIYVISMRLDRRPFTLRGWLHFTAWVVAGVALVGLLHRIFLP